MKKTILLCTAALITTAALAQQPRIKNQKEYGGSDLDGLRGLCTTHDGGLLVGGYSTSPASGNKLSHNKGYYDMWIIKQDSLGKKQWERALGGYGDEVLLDQKATPDGGYILCGFSTSNVSGEKKDPSKGGYDYWVVKIDSLGKVQWDRSLGGSNNDLGESVDLTSDGGYIVAGITLSAASGNITENSYGNTDLWVVKLDAAGNLQWQNRLGGSSIDGYNTSQSGASAFSFHLAICRQAPDGGFLVAAASASNASGDKTANSKGAYDYWIIKLDANGNQVWDKTIGGSGDDFVEDLQITSDGGFVTCGYSNSQESGDKTEFSKGSLDYWIVKMDAAGNIQWDKTIGGNRDDAAQAILQTADGSYVIAGFSESGRSGDKTTISRSGYDYWVVKIDGTGNVLWDKTIGGTAEDYAVALVQDSPNSYVVGGESASYVSGNKTEENYGSRDYWGVQLVENAEADAAPIAATSNNKAANISNTKTFLAYPNPVTTVLHIQNVGKTNFVLTDLSGKRMLTKIIEGNGEINVANIPSGTYYLTNTTTGITQKVIITK